MDINVTITLPGIPEALNALADAIRSTKCECSGHAAKTPEPTPVPEKPAPEKRSRKAKAEATPVAEQAPAKTETAPAKTPEPVAAEPAATEPTYTLDQISYAGVDLMERGYMDDLIAMLAKYGIQSLTAADPSLYGAIAKDLIAMGATIGG